MAFDAHANFAYSVVVTAPSPAASGTSLAVTSGTGALFPAVPFNATVWPSNAPPLADFSEIVRVTNIVGDVLTITRAQEGTAAVSIAVGYQLAASLTVKTITDLESAVNAALTNIKVSAGTLSTLRSDLSFANSNGVSFGLNTNGVITASAATAVTGSMNVSAGTTSGNLASLVFSNGNNVSFGLNGGTLTASIPNVLTTAMASDRGSNFIQATAAFHGTNISGTIGSNDISLSVNPSISTARASNDGIGLNTAASNVTWTANSAGLTLDGRGYAGTGTTFNGTNVSGSVTLNSNGLNLALSANVGGGAGSLNVSAGTTSNNLTNVVFSDGNNVSFGLNGSTVTASVPSYTTIGTATTVAPVGTANSVGTASRWAAEDHVHALTPSSFGVSNLGNTAGTSGIVSAFPARVLFAGGNNITLSQSVNGASATITISGANAGGAQTGISGLSAGTTQMTSGTAVFGNANGVSFGVNGNTVTASIANYLTTARASTDAIGLNTAATNVTWTVNSNGLSLNAGGYAGTATGATNASVTVNSGGVSVSVGPYITTAMASNRGSDFVQATAAFAGTNASGTIASNGISVSVGNYITTARASNDAVGLNTAGTNVTWTVNSSGLSLNAAGYAGTGTTFNGTNVSATVGLNSAGLNLSLSAGAGGGGTLTMYATGNTGGQSSSTTFNASSLPISGMGNLTVGYSGGNLIISGGTAAASPVAISAGTASASLSNIVFSNLNAVSFGLNGSTVTASVSTYSTIGTATTVRPIGTAAATVGTADRWAREDHVHAFQDVTESVFWRPNDNLTTVGAPINGTASVIYCPVDHNLSATRFDLIGSVNVATAANASSAGVLYSITAALYTLNNGTLSSVLSTTTNNQMTWSSNVTGNVTGGFFFSAPLTVNASADKYWVAVALSTRATGLTGAATTSLANTITMMGVGSAIHGAFSAREPGAATANSNGWFYGMGLYSGTSNFATIGLSNLTQQGTNANRANVALRMLNV